MSSQSGALTVAEIESMAADITRQIKQLAIQRRSEKRGEIASRLRSESGRFLRSYLDEGVLDLARAEIPVDDIHVRAQKHVSDTNAFGHLEGVMAALLDWFKGEYMIWVNNHPCDACGATDTVGIGSGSPTQADLADGADRVELYSCQQCKTVTRFPRFNNVLRLMKTRKGRCGEWANLFTLFSCAMGYETRYVMDFTDHVWCEFYSETYGRWVNVDPSEGSGSIDQPLMYEAGWGKKLTYIFAIGEYEVVDVFRRYTRDVPAMLKRRNLAREIIISQLTSDITQSLRRTLPASLVQSLRERDTKELEELLNPPARPLRQSETMGRKSGNLDWRTARGETGSIFSASNARSVPQLMGAKVISHSTPLNLVGSAKQLPSSTSPNTRILQLTPAETDKRGAAWARIPLPTHPTQPLTLTVAFTFRAGRPDGSPGADGLAFVLHAQGPDALGTGGSGLGYAGINSSIAVEFDTYASRDTCADPDENHVSVHTAGRGMPNSAHHRYSVGCTSSVPDLGANKPIWVRVVVDLVGKGGLDVYLKEREDEEFHFVLHGNLDANAIVGYSDSGELFIGCTAATGGICQLHEVLSFEAFLK